MKLTEMRELTDAELEQQIAAAHKELFETRLKHSLHQLENTAQFRLLRHRVAQLNTVLKEKQRAKIAGGKKK
jgi:large subunit ribosomal protein L29